VLLPVYLAEEILIGMKNLMQKKKKRGLNTKKEDWSDASNSASKGGGDPEPANSTSSRYCRTKP
jgi:hypothetical protein